MILQEEIAQILQGEMYIAGEHLPLLCEYFLVLYKYCRRYCAIIAKDITGDITRGIMQTLQGKVAQILRVKLREYYKRKLCDYCRRYCAIIAGDIARLLQRYCAIIVRDIMRILQVKVSRLLRVKLREYYK